MTQQLPWEPDDGPKKQLWECKRCGTLVRGNCGAFVHFIRCWVIDRLMPGGDSS